MHARGLLALVLVGASGCYAPDLRDCTVTCAGPDECSGDQVCNSAGLCAAEGVTCGGGATVDAQPMITLRVQVQGTGKVVIEGVGECEDNDCMWTLPPRALRFTARELDDENPFERWLTVNCAPSTQPSCMFTPSSSTTVGAKFR